MIKSLPLKDILAKPCQELLHCSYQLCIKSQQKFRIFFVSAFRAPVEVALPRNSQKSDFSIGDVGYVGVGYVNRMDSPQRRRGHQRGKDKGLAVERVMGCVNGTVTGLRG
jgi:hypothetical protein